MKRFVTASLLQGSFEGWCDLDKRSIAYGLGPLVALWLVQT